jgi:hypothetical protein
VERGSYTGPAFAGGYSSERHNWRGCNALTLTRLVSSYWVTQKTTSLIFWEVSLLLNRVLDCKGLSKVSTRRGGFHGYIGGWESITLTPKRRSI